MVASPTPDGADGIGFYEVNLPPAVVEETRQRGRGHPAAVPPPTMTTRSIS
jgi:hypothetical protein